MFDGQQTRVAVIPTCCPRFAAACFTCGIALEPGTPGVDNVYSQAVKYDPDEPGSVSFYLSDKQGINPLALAKVWVDWVGDLSEAATLPQRILGARQADQVEQVAADLDQLTVLAAVAHMRLFTLSRFGVDSPNLADEEARAAVELSGLPEKLRKGGNRGQIGARLAACWRPAMFAWVKAWIHNYREIKDTWTLARPAIKFEREGRLPLVIRKGPKFETLLKRWKR